MTQIKKIEDLSPIKKKVEVHLPAEEVALALEQSYAQIQKKAKIKGFRPGKAPRAVLEQYYRADAEEGALRELVNRSYPEAIDESGLLPVSPPEIEVVEFEVTKGLSYSASFEIRPEIEIKGYEGLKLEREKSEVDEKEVGARLDFLRERLARLVPVIESRPLKAGDVAMIDYAGFDGDKNFTGGLIKDYVAEVGQGKLLPEFEKGLLTIARGEKKRIIVRLPDDFPDKNKAGHEVSYEVLLKDFKQKVLPELNDDLAKDLGRHTTLEELKAEIRQEIQKEKEHQVRARLKEQVVDKLCEKNPFPVPEGMTHAELDAMWRSFLNYLQNQGVPPEKAGITPEEFANKNRDVATKRVQSLLLFEAIAKKQNIFVTPEEIDKKFEEMSPATGQAPVTLRKMYESRNLILPLEESLRAEKTLDFVLNTAKIKVKS
ncbi:MAG: trigger factor [Deltaproteobacteria bacterium]|nr:trigger factor [Deltaproteobacteria bacterium]